MPCLIDRVSIFVTGAYSNVSSPTTSRQSHQVPLRAGLVPALTPSPTDRLHSTARPAACTASRPKTVNNPGHRWRRFPARLFTPPIWDASFSNTGLILSPLPFPHFSLLRRLRPATCAIQSAQSPATGHCPSANSPTLCAAGQTLTTFVPPHLEASHRKSTCPSFEY